MKQNILLKLTQILKSSDSIELTRSLNNGLATYCTHLVPLRVVLPIGFTSKRMKKKLERVDNLSFPIWISSKLSHCPRASGEDRLVVTEWMRPPHAFWVRFRSSSVTLPAQNMSLSANHWVATSPIGRRDSTILAPLASQAASFSYRMLHSASTT